MIVSFIGCPASGKTTTAAMLFAELKKLGISAEFICEEARIHIASIRYEQGLSPSDPVHLTDRDQQEIMEAQWQSEEVLSTVCGPSVVVVSDSSALNSLLYMSPARRDSQEVQDLLEVYRCDLVFYTPPLATVTHGLDPNRVHSQSESLRIDSLIPEILAKYVPGLIPIRLEGDPGERLQKALLIILKRIEE